MAAIDYRLRRLIRAIHPTRSTDNMMNFRRISGGTEQQENGNKAARSTDKKHVKPGFGSIMLSVLAAAIGVQNSRNHERDFQQQSPIPYIVAGVIFTALFMSSLIFIVRIVLLG
ncbi:MAG: hypothetical protein ACI9Y1_002156 [Lentisphaeria bacterium]|jgi:hypothetical protein